MHPPASAFVAPVPLTRGPAARRAARTTTRLPRTPTATASNRSSWASSPSPAQPSSTPATAPPPAAAPGPAAAQARTPAKRDTPQRTAPRRDNADSPAPDQLVPYFAYFSNLNPRRLGPASTFAARRFTLHDSRPATLRGRRLSFTVPGLPPEPAFATLEAAGGDAAVEGMLHYISRDDFASLRRSEPGMRVESVTLHVTGADGGETTITARTFVSRVVIPDWLPERLRPRPSRRYVQLAVDGARYWRMNRRYVRDTLAQVRADDGPLSLFGLAVEPRAHPLDRPSRLDDFGDPASELFSPYKRVDDAATAGAMDAFGVAERDATSADLRLVQLTPPRDAQKTDARRPLYFLPGIDGVGKSVISQVADIERDGVYDLKAFVVPFDNRQTVDELADSILSMIHADAAGQAVSILAESMGAVVGILMALENQRRLSAQAAGAGDAAEPTLQIDLLLMLNPATSFARSQPRPLWDTLLALDLPQAAYASLVPIVLMPFLLDVTSAQQAISAEMAPRLRRMLTTIPEIAQTLPRDALAHRIAQLGRVDVSDAQLARLARDAYGPMDIAVVAAANDRLLPSLSEAYRFRRVVPRLYSAVLSFGGHAAMFDPRFSLAGLLQPFARGPRGAAAAAAGNGGVGVSAPAPSERTRRKAAALRRKYGGTVDADVTKTRTELRELRTFLSDSLRDHSPVFVGEENLAGLSKSEPVLFVCNHTLLAWFDGGHLILRMLDKHNKQLHALANPILFANGDVSFPGTTSVSADRAKSFGISEVSPTRIVSQLASNCWSLLFPGGAREALKQPGDKKYGLIWPDDAEFVRMCGVFGATIVPVGTIGTEDMVRVVGGSDVTRRIVETGSRLAGREFDFSTTVDQSRQWQGGARAEGSTEDGVTGSMLPPVMLPVGADRIYFKFGEPIRVPDAAVWDKRVEQQVYDTARKSVEECVDTLLRRRAADELRSKERRAQFREEFGDGIEPPAGQAWVWATGDDAYLDERNQPPL